MEVLAYILVSFIIMILGLRFAMVTLAKRQKGKPVPELSGEYKKAVKKGKKSLFYFYGPTCPPCIQMTPIVEKIANAKDNVFKVDISKEMNVAKKFGIMGTPSIVIIENGIIKDVLFGPQSEQQINQAF